MKIAFCFDVANNFVPIIKGLHLLGVEATLYVIGEHSQNATPENDSPKFKDSNVNWIKRVSHQSLLDLGLGTSPLIKELSQYDIVIGSNLFPIMIPSLRTPRRIFFPTGSDLTLLPFYFNARSIKELKNFQFRKVFYHLLQTYFVRRGIKTADGVFLAQGAPLTGAVEALNLSRRNLIPWENRFCIDTSLFDASQFTKENVLAKYDIKDGAPILFHPSRLMCDPRTTNIETGQWKNNLVVLNAYRALLETHPNATLLVLKSTMAGDVDYFHSKAEEMGIGNKIQWVSREGLRPFHRYELAEIYSIADYVFNDFGVGWFGSVDAEALSSGCILFTHAGEFMSEGRTFFSTKESDFITNKIIELEKNPLTKKLLSSDSRKTAVSHFSPQVIASYFLNCILMSNEKA